MRQDLKTSELNTVLITSKGKVLMEYSCEEWSIRTYRNGAVVIRIKPPTLATRDVLPATTTKGA